jgi:hypothetical protein
LRMRRSHGEGAREQGETREREMPQSLLPHEFLPGLVRADDAINPGGSRSFP